MDPLTIIAAAAGEEESSKTAFFVLAGVAAAWAVVLSFIGLTQPDFPREKGAARGVMALGVVLTVGTMVATVATS